MATDIIARGMAANAKKSVTALGNKIESEKWIGTKAEWEAVDKSTIKDGTIVYITDDETVILYDKAEMEKIAAQVAADRKAAETAAHTAQSVADSLPEDYVTAVAKIAENTAEIGRIKLMDKELQRRVNALYDIGQGVTHKFETDSETAYQKAVTTGGKLMSVKSIGGRSVVFNQIFETYSGTNNGVTVTTETDGTITLNGTAESSYVYFKSLSPAQNKVGKYILKLLILNNPDSITMRYAYFNRTITTPAVDKGTASVLVSQTATDIELQKVAGISGFTTGTVFNNVKIKVQIFDLTSMFGSGNEPASVEEFEKMFPADYYPYNAGEIVSAGTESVVEQGKNLFDYTDKTYHGANVSEVENGVIYTKQLLTTILNIPTIVGNKYTLSLKTKSISTSQGILRWSLQKGKNTAYADDSSLIKKVVGTVANTEYQETVTFTATTDFVSLCGLTTMVYDVQLENGDTATNYSPFYQTEHTIPEAIRNLPGYGWSAGTAKNWVDYENKKYVQCVSSIDLGTLNWKLNTTSGVGQHFYTVVDRTKFKYLGASGTTVHNILCSKYQTVARSANVFVDKTITLDGTGTAISQIQIKDTAYTDATTFKQAMQGVILYYELATPIVTDISTLIDDDFLRNVEVEAGGSVTFKSGNDDYRIPVPNEEEYVVKLSEVGGTT